MIRRDCGCTRPRADGIPVPFLLESRLLRRPGLNSILEVTTGHAHTHRLQTNTRQRGALNFSKATSAIAAYVQVSSRHMQSCTSHNGTHAYSFFFRSTTPRVLRYRRRHVAVLCMIYSTCSRSSTDVRARRRYWAQYRP